MAKPTWTENVKLRHLRIFTTVAQHPSLTAAAAALRITQPALSKWLRELESQIGDELFTRGRQLQLRPSGEILLHYVQRMFGELHRARDELTVLRGGQAGSVRVGTVFGPASMLVPHAVAMLREVAPAIGILLDEGTVDRLLPRLEAKELDVVVGRLEEQTLNAEVTCEALYHEAACVVARDGHPLTLRKTLGWRDTHEYPWIVPVAGMPMRLRIEEAFALVGLSVPGRRIESASPIANLMLLRDTDHLTVMAGHLARRFETSRLLRTLPLEIRQGLGPVGMLWIDKDGTATTPAVQRFLECLRTQARKLNESPQPRGTSRSRATSRSPRIDRQQSE